MFKQSGAPAGIRTPNLLIRSQMLYPLSYGRLENSVIYYVIIGEKQIKWVNPN